MKAGERRYIECAYADYQTIMRAAITPRSRRPEALRGMEFASTLYTAISARDCADVRYLVAVDRLA